MLSAFVNRSVLVPVPVIKHRAIAPLSVMRAISFTNPYIPIPEGKYRLHSEAIEDLINKNEIELNGPGYVTSLKQLEYRHAAQVAKMNRIEKVSCLSFGFLVCTAIHASSKYLGDIHTVMLASSTALMAVGGIIYTARRMQCEKIADDIQREYNTIFQSGLMESCIYRLDMKRELDRLTRIEKKAEIERVARLERKIKHAQEAQSEEMTKNAARKSVADLDETFNKKTEAKRMARLERMAELQRLIHFESDGPSNRTSSLKP